jgi:hypothetical protein
MKQMLLNIILAWRDFKNRDPLRGCEAYKHGECFLPDDPYCDVKTCLINKRYEKKKKDRSSLSVFIR